MVFVYHRWIEEGMTPRHPVSRGHTACGIDPRKRKRGLFVIQPGARLPRGDRRCQRCW